MRTPVRVPEVITRDPRLTTLSVTLLAAFLLGGCGGTMQYRVGNETFASRDEALKRLDQQLNDVTSSIPATQTPVKASAVLAIPTLDQIKAKGVKTTGNWSVVSAEKGQEMISYSAITVQKNVQFMVNAVQRRQVFDRVSVVESPAPETLSADGADFLVYYHLVNPDIAQWYIKGKGLTEPKPLMFDTGKAMGVPRTVAWLDSLEAAARDALSK